MPSAQIQKLHRVVAASDALSQDPGHLSLEQVLWKIIRGTSSQRTAYGLSARRDGGERSIGEVTWRNPARRHHENHVLAIGGDVEERGQEVLEEATRVTLVPHEQVHEHRVPFRGGGDPAREARSARVKYGVRSTPRASRLAMLFR